MRQQHCVINLDQQRGYMPKSIGAPDTLLGQAHSPIACAVLLRLLANQWAGDRVGLIGDLAQCGDLGHPLLPSTDMWKAVSTGNGASGAGWEARDTAASAGFARFARTSTSGQDGQGNPIIEYQYKATITRPERHEGPPVALLNFTKNQHLKPRFLGDGLSLSQVATAGHDGGTGTALMLLLAASCKGGPRGEGDVHSTSPLVGSWAGDRLAVVPEATLPHGTEPITSKVRRMLEDAGQGTYASALDGTVFRPEPISA